MPKNTEPRYRIPLDTFMECWIRALSESEEKKTLQEMAADLSDKCNALAINDAYIQANGSRDIKTSAVTAKMNYYIKNWNIKLEKPKSKAKSKADEAKKKWIEQFAALGLVEQ